MTSKPAKGGASAAKDATTLNDVERALAASSPVPEDIAAEVKSEATPDLEALNAAKLRSLWNQVKQRDSGWQKAKERAESEAKLLADERERLALELVSATERADRVAAREADVAKAEIEIEILRSSAKAGFANDRRAMIQEAADRRDAILAETADLEEQSKAAAIKAAASVREALDEEKQQLADEWRRFGEEQVALRELQAKAAEDVSFALQREKTLEAQMDRIIELRVTEIQQERDELAQLLQLERDGHEARKEAVRDLRSKLSLYPEDPAEMKRQVDTLILEVRSLGDELSRRPPAEEISALRQRAETSDNAVAEANQLRQQYERVERQLRYQMVSVGEVEVLRDERDSLTAQRETLRQALDQQRADWEELQENDAAREPFPACTSFDADPALTRSMPTRGFDTLADLVVELQNRMATQSATSFYYSESDVRLFLAGLAASRLHLLQGISGTGKTSLPREFFKALSGDDAVRIIEVQAGWRDKDDLFGYYNAFEKRFAESEFTKALYKALLPANVDRALVIVLDEMNLAHPEQYFGSMLSILENATSDRAYIDLLTSALPGMPDCFDGARLPLAPNVWFVGTANQDETTVAFADKTYDRAHVQELPPRHEPFNAKQQSEADPISFSELEGAFARASRDFEPEARRAKAFLHDELHEEFAPFGIGWGNRLERQIDRFVPVAIDGGGSLTEAVDHLVASKLVRKLEDRFGVRPDDLDQLADTIESMWQLDRDRPIKTLSRIRREASRLRGGYGS